MSSAKKRSSYFSSSTDTSTAAKRPRLSGQSAISCAGPSRQSSEASVSDVPMPKSLPRSFFDVPCQELARKLLGAVLVRKHPSLGCLRARIVETEAYLGGEDKGAHSYNGKRTERNEAMYMKPGTLYAYTIYGMYCCLNVSARGDGAAVLLRAVEPVDDKTKSAMEQLRLSAGKTKRTKPLKKKELCSGPGRLTQALDITMAMNKADCVSNDNLFFESGASVRSDNVVVTQRVGIAYAGPVWADKPFRFYVQDSQFVSVRTKTEKSQAG